MSEQSKEADRKANTDAVETLSGDVKSTAASAVDAPDNQSSSGEDVQLDGSSEGAAADAGKHKKKSKRQKLKDALLKGKEPASASHPELSNAQMKELLQANPALRTELADKDPAKLQEELKKLSLSDLLTGMSAAGKDRKDMASYKFWRTQPVPSFQDEPPTEEGPIKIIDVEQVPKEPPSLNVDGFEWVTMDLNDDKQLEEVYSLLCNHYVEDDDAMFRFNYSSSFLNWALKSPGWKADWHVGIRASQSGKLVAFISGIPVNLRIRKQSVKCSEINFLCIHKKLRSKRLAPILIKEITRRCYADGVFQAIYTAGIILPKPVSTCRYFHRPLNWQKLYEVGFSAIPPKSSETLQNAKYRLPANATTKGLRKMQKSDVDGVLDLLQRYLERFDLAQNYSREEVQHWLLNEAKSADEQVIWAYVVEDADTHKITDFLSYYSLPSTVIGKKKHSHVNAAYLFYYATASAFNDDAAAHKARLNLIMTDALTLAKQQNFDVMNALTLLHNPLFLEKCKYAPGDGRLHYYLFNYRATPIAGGTNAKDQLDEKYAGGIGVVML